MRLLKLLTIFLAVSSTLALVLASRATARPLTTIGAIQPSMNFAYVRVEGVVPGYPSLSAQDGFLSFRVQDQSGDMRVSAYRGVVEKLLHQRRIPLPGDRVVVEGTLRVRDDEASLIVNAPDALQIETPDASTVLLAALDALQLGERAQTAGQVRRIRNIGDALQIVTLRDGNATADVVLPLNLRLLLGEWPDLQVGDWISVTGGVGEYRGARQLLPARVSNIVGARKSNGDHVRPIGALSKDLLGQWVEVKGVVSDLRPFSQGMRVDVQEDSGQAITAVLFDSVWQNLPFSGTVSVGDPIRVQGELIEFRGELEIQPELAVDVAGDW
jgi:DNA/RNA endonuclease YhcR with UshA esterase domain